MSFELNQIVRKNILELKPYSSARNEYSGKEAVFMDANENPYNAPYNRYPDPNQSLLKQKIAELYNIGVSKLFLGNGSDEAIDLIFRSFCEPAIDRAVSIEPSYGMYKVCADIQNVEMDFALLNEDFSLNIENISSKIKEKTKVIFLCSPNNPTSNLLEEDKVIEILKIFKGLVVVDEAYIDFAESEGMLRYLDEFPNLIVLRTFSKAWGLAGIRIGMAFASVEIINILNKIKYPYNLNVLSQEFALEAIFDISNKNRWILEIRSERERLRKELDKFFFIIHIYPSDANFLLVKTKNPKGLYTYLSNEKIIVRDRSNVPLCEACLRITIGTKEENNLLLEKLKNYSS